MCSYNCLKLWGIANCLAAFIFTIFVDDLRGYRISQNGLPIKTKAKVLQTDTS